MKKAFFSVLMALVLVLAGSGWAEDFNVSNVTELRGALSTAEGNGQDDTINIAPGTYNASGSTFSYTPALGPPEENYSLTIIGSGAGITLLDGGDSVLVMYIDMKGLSDDSNGHITARGITFQNGWNAPQDNNGGGLYAATNQGNIVVEDCQFSGNGAALNGGGLYAISSQGNLVVEDCQFTANTAYHAGGAFVESVDSPAGNVTLANNTFTGNSAVIWGGGAVAFSSSGFVTFTNNIFNGNNGWRVG